MGDTRASRSGASSAAISLADVLAARERIAPHVRSTPLVASQALKRLTGAAILLKLETRQVTRSFKARGAANAMLQRPPGSLVVTASGGNHGRAIAWAAERFGLRALVFTPRTAPRAKVDAILAHGAELRAEAATYDEAERRALAAAGDLGAAYISPYSHPHVMAGAGSVGLELLEQAPDAGTIVVPIGGGGLISGVAVAVKGRSPSTRIIGVEADASAAFTAARAAGRVVPIEVGPTIADGLGGNVEPDTLTWPVIRDLVDEVVTVGEEDILAAMRHLEREEGEIAEGAGATALAAVLTGRVDVSGRRTAVLVTGANVDRKTGG